MSNRIRLQTPAVPRVTVLALAFFLPAAGGPASAQEPELHGRAQAALTSGDTLAALVHLRDLTEQEPEYAPGWGLLGQVLTEGASSVMHDFRQRLEAEKALRRAWELDPTNPTYLLHLAALMRKQWKLTDSRRVLNRARGYMEKNSDAIPPADRAALWYLLGLNHEDVYLDTRNLVFAPNLPVQTPDCASLGTFCLNFTRPEDFNEHFRHAASLSDEAQDDYEQMELAFRRALEADSTHAGAFRRLAIHLIERGQYDEALRLGRRFRDDAPESPWGYMTLGLVYYRTGQDSLAEIEFDNGLARAAPDIAEHYQDVSTLMRESQADKYSQANAEARRRLEEVLWRKSDPLYLTPANEIRVSHLARVSFADLYFEDPSSGLWGAETERGQVYVRYGPPERIFQVQRDVSKEMSAQEFDASQSSARGGGRWIFWNYAWHLPNFIFEKQLQSRHASHVLSSRSKFMEEEAREVMPAVYSTSYELADYPVQIARFRGQDQTTVEVDLYSEIPGAQLLTRPDTLELGVFLFAGAEQTEAFRRTLRAHVTPDPKALTYTLPLSPGRYSVSLEARSPEYKAAVHREDLDIQAFPDSALGLSDIVLADAVTPLGDNSSDRRGFAIKVNRHSVFDSDLPVAFYWEVYGLTADPEGLANYQVTLSITDAEGKGVLARVAEAFGFGREERVELSYERLVAWDGERVPEYLSVALVDSEPGQYRLRITVDDRVSGKRSVGERLFELVRVD